MDILDSNFPNACIIGDFNAVLGAHKRTSDVSVHNRSVKEFQAFITVMDLFDVDSSGNPYTWTACHSSTGFMVAGLDRVLASLGFLNLWLNVELLVLTRHCSDHHPLHLTTAV